MKILYVIESLSFGGKERRLISLIKRMLVGEDIEIELLLLSKDIHYNEIHDLKLKIHFLKRNLKKDPNLLFKFHKILKEFLPDIVHCWDTIASIQFAALCKIKGIPFINSMISTAPPVLSRFSARYIYNAISYPFSDVILTNSKAGLVSFRVPEAKGKYIYNGFDFDRVNVKNTPKTIKMMLNINAEKVVGMVASFTEMKDYKTFVKAGEEILKNRSDVIFISIGAGPNYQKIKNSIRKKYRLNFRFLGKQEDIESIVNIFDIGVLATFSEGISNAIMEYMALEKPVIATDGGGTKELVINKENGFLVEQKNVGQLVEKINYLLNNAKKASDMGAKGKERIKKYFSIGRMASETLDLYKSCIK